jgi:hypothetical protein
MGIPGVLNSQDSHVAASFLHSRRTWPIRRVRGLDVSEPSRLRRGNPCRRMM